MIVNPKDQPVGDYLKKLLPIVLNIHSETQRIVIKAEGLQTAADLSKLDFEHFINSYTELLAVVAGLAAANKELEELLRVSIATKLNNAIILANNLAILTELDPTLIASVINRVRRADIMAAALGMVTAEHLDWIREAVREGE